MTRDEIFNWITEFLVRHAQVDAATITEQSHFFNDLNLDSLDIAEMVLDIDDTFAVTVPDEEIEQAQTVGKAVDLILKHI